MDNVHYDHKNAVQLWANGFRGGLMWLMYEATQNEYYMLTAKRSEELLDPALNILKTLDGKACDWDASASALPITI